MKYIQGDLIALFKQGEFDVIAHQCNCRGFMGAGIAKYLYKEFPQIYKYYNLYSDIELFGTIGNTFTKNGQITNIYSQFEPGGCTEWGIDSFDVRIGALRTCLKQMNILYSRKRIGLPLIASGIAADIKLKKEMNDQQYFECFIRGIIQDELTDMDVTIIYL